MWRISRALEISISQSQNVEMPRTKSIVATSDAVVRKAGPALGFGMRAMTVLLSFIRKRNTLLKPPSAIFTIDVHSVEPTLLAATL